MFRPREDGDGVVLKVYAVTYSDYEDYSVLGIFMDPKSAFIAAGFLAVDGTPLDVRSPNEVEIWYVHDSVEQMNEMDNDTALQEAIREENAALYSKLWREPLLVSKIKRGVKVSKDNRAWLEKRGVAV